MTGQDEAEAQDEIEVQEEVADLKIAPAPVRPSQAAIEDHNVSHLPYRNWCAPCVEGRGLGEQRGRHAGRVHDVPRVGIDYWYITTGTIKMRKELVDKYPLTTEGNAALEDARKKRDIMKCLILRCHESKALFAHAVPVKGDDEDHYVADLIASDVAFMGHVRLLIKSDNEPALLKLAEAALVKIRCQVQKGESSVESASSEQAAEHESASNGGTECGIRSVRGLFRTIKLCTQRRIGQEIPPTHPLSTWLLEHVCLLLNALHVGEDGKTAWRRLRGRDFGQRLIGFAENVFYKQPAKGPQHDVGGNMTARMFPGVFLGYHPTSNCYRVATAEGNVIKARSLLRRPLADRWNAETIKAIVATPWSLRSAANHERIELGKPVEKDEKPQDDQMPMPRRLRITLKTIEEYGTTDGCAQCSHVRAFREAKPGLMHSEPCRRRIIEAMSATDAGAVRLERHNTRVDRAIASRIEVADQRGRAAGADDGPPVREDVADDVLRKSSRLCPAPGGCGVPGAQGVPADEASHAETPGSDSDENPLRSDSDDEAMGETLTVADIKARGDDVQQNGAKIRENGAYNIFKNIVRGDSGPNVQDEVQLPCRKGADGDDGSRTAPTTIANIRRHADVKTTGDDAQDGEIMMIMAVLGADPKSFRREKRQAVRRIVSELYSPPRVTAMLRRMTNHGLTPGLALDLTTTDPDDGTPWDFNLPEKREKALGLLRAQKPLFVIGSPMCTRWCTWQRLNDAKRSAEIVEAEKQEALIHLEFVAEVYREQIEGNRFFLHEHPEGAGSWEEQCIADLLTTPGVARVRGDQCQYDQEVQYGQYQGQPVRKATGFMSNASRLLARLERRCTGRNGACSRRKGGRHVTASGKVARDAARYSSQLCRAIVKGMIDEMQWRGIWRRGEVGLHAMTDEDPIAQFPDGCTGKFRDDVTGQLLKDELVREARAKELQYFCDKGVWEKRPKHEARQKTGRGAISVRWVDVNKGDDLHPRYRSRLVARQLKAHDRSGASFFAPTPPLEALRSVLSLAATSIGDWRPCYDKESERRTQISLMDVARAYFNAKLDPGVSTYVQLPAEDSDSENMCAKLIRHMYGTRAAADGWQEEYSTFLVETLRFSQGASSPCVFRHPTKELMMSVHGDDFTTVGAKEDLDWLESEMQAHYELTIQPRLGPGDGDAKEAIVLNRVIRWTDQGIEYEADPRQSEKLVTECGMAGTNSVATPGVRLSFDQLEKDTELPANLHTAFRGSAARANYLAADRLDCQFAAKEICRWMAKPTRAAWEALKRLCRYLVGLPRAVFHYKWQTVDQVDVYTDTDWAGCPRTRKSTSGGCVILGTHPIKSWSSTQSSVALSSGEAEFNGVVRGAGVGLGYQSLLRDLGIEVGLRVWTDSSAAIGICSRQGLGKLRHLDTHTLWVQQAVRSKRVDLRKVAGEVNPADLFTKHSLTRERLMGLTRLFGLEFQGGRAASAPQTRVSASTRATLAEVMAVDSGHECVGEQDPIMPHLSYSKADLDEVHPPIKAVEADDDDEPNDDALLNEGIKVAQEIVEQASSFGRRRIQRKVSYGQRVGGAPIHDKGSD